MPVLKTTSPAMEVEAPKEAPWKQAPSSRMSSAFMRLGSSLSLQTDYDRGARDIRGYCRLDGPRCEHQIDRRFDYRTYGGQQLDAQHGNSLRCKLISPSRLASRWRVAGIPATAPHTVQAIRARPPSSVIEICSSSICTHRLPARTFASEGASRPPLQRGC